MTEDSGKTKKVFDGRYEILSIVGRGARSVVYRARNIQEPKSEVALKVLLSRKDGSSNSDRLRKEALAMVSSRHKYVIRLDDFHSLGDLCYLAMEYAPEADLKKYLTKLGGSLPIEQIEQFLLQILEGLSFIHQAGIIHRDLKPENILVIDGSNVRIGDFGVAVLPGEKSSFEELQKGVGTMDYMAPEVLEGISYEQCADVYSLGVTFYEIITGTHPFRNISMIKQLEARQDENLADIRKLRPEIPEYIASAIMRAMSYDPANRFPTGRQFLQALKGEKELASDRPKSRARKLTRNDREKLRSEIRNKKKEKPESESLEAALEAIFAETETATAELSQPAPPVAPTATEVAPAAPAGPTVAPDPYLSRWSDGGADGKTIGSEVQETPSYEAPVEAPVVEELPEEEPEEAPVTETGEVAQLGSKSDLVKNGLIAIGLLVLAFMIYQRLFGGTETSEDQVSEQGQIISILPASSDEMAAFPKFSQGVYAGVLSGATPEGLVPLTIIAMNTDEIIVMLGVHGFVPVRVKTAELATDAQSLIIRSGGISLELTGQIEGSKVSGWVRNIITHEEGAWSVQAVR